MKKILICTLLSVCLLTACNKTGDKLKRDDIKTETVESSSKTGNTTDIDIERDIISYENGKYEYPAIHVANNIENYSGTIGEYTQKYSINTTYKADKDNYMNILGLKDYFITCDTQGGKLKVLDSDLNVIKEVGSYGNGALQFIQPRCLDKDMNSNIYVLELGNSRIQVLDKDFNYIKEIVVQWIDGVILREYTDMVVDDSGKYAYISDMQLASIIRIDLETGQSKKIEEYLVGSFIKVNTDIYFIDGGYFEKFSTKGNSRFVSSVNYLRILDNEKFKVVNRLYDYSTIICATEVDNNIYCGSWYLENEQGSNVSGSIICSIDINGVYLGVPYGNEGLIGKKYDNYDKLIIDITRLDNGTIGFIYRDVSDSGNWNGQIAVLKDN